MREQAILLQASDASQERVPSSSRLVVTVDKRLGAVGERVEVLPSLSGIVVLSCESGCQVWLRSVDVRAWFTACRGNELIRQDSMRGNLSARHRAERR